MSKEKVQGLPPMGEVSAKVAMMEAMVDEVPLKKSQVLKNQIADIKKIKSPMKVKATRPGFYGNSRIPEGAEFTIKSGADFGSWMKIVE
jgi:hypothetical protein